MKIFLTFLKWIFIILLFPLSLIFVAYYKQQKIKKEFYKSRHEQNKVI